MLLHSLMLQLQNQTEQFMANLAAQIAQFNTSTTKLLLHNLMLLKLMLQKLEMLEELQM